MTCDSDLQKLILEMSEKMELIVLEGHRGKEEQNLAFSKGTSRAPWPRSKHNSEPSLAVDIAPIPNGNIDWGNLNAFYFMGGYAKGVAYKLGINVRWGGMWLNDNSIIRQSFNDLAHFELIK